MKPRSFACVRAKSLDEVFDLLEEHGDDARILSGGQSLIPSLNLRLSAPTLLIDINRVPDLSEIAHADDTLSIGALARHSEVANSALVARHAPLVATAVPHIAHQAIRNRGTFGGSIALADPAAELPAVCVALGARFVLRSRAATRTISADEFFLGLFETALEPNEVLVKIEIPGIRADERCGFLELAQRHGDYAMIGLAAQGTLRDGTFSNMRLAFFAAGDRPVLATHACAALEGRSLDAETLSAATRALGQDLSPSDDLTGPAEMKVHLAKVITGRVLHQMAA
jgi:aerobic carbon-monoxide dehydrogenase medium subunit